MSKRPFLQCGLLLTLTAALSAAEPPRYGAEDFLPTPHFPVGFRGDGSGIYAWAMPPLVFSEKTNVLWATKIPVVEKPGSWSHSPPVVVGNRVFISAEPDSTLCLDADTGRILWRQALGLFQTTTECLAMHSGNDFSTASSDGQAVYRLFSGGTTDKKNLSVLVSYDLAGQQRWLAKLPAAADALQSPLLLDGRFVVRCRHSASADLIAYDAATGAIAWGPKKYQTASADGNPWGDGTDGGLVSLRLDGRALVLAPGGLCFDPRTGELLARSLTAQDSAGRSYNRLGFDIGGQWSVYNTPVVRAEADGSATVVFSGSDGKTFTGTDKEGLTPVPTDSDLTQPAWEGRKFVGGIRVLACRLSLDAKGQIRSEPLWPQPAALVVRESGQLHPHASLCGERIALLHVKGQLGVVDLKTGRLLGKDFQPVYPCEYKTAHKRYDLNAPAVLAALAEYELDPQMVFGGKGDQSFARMGRTVYARTAVDARGYLYLANRMHDFFVVELTDDGFKVLAKNVIDHPVCIYSHAEPVLRGNRIYYRTWTHMFCFEKAN